MFCDCLKDYEDKSGNGYRVGLLVESQNFRALRLSLSEDAAIARLAF
jgi:hypothetical protein